MAIRQEKAIFVGFKKIISLHSHQPIPRVKKSFFQTLTRLLFCLVEFFLRIFHTCYTYVKCSLESKLTIDINESIIRHVKVDIRQERAIFVGFKKIMLQNMDWAPSEISWFWMNFRVNFFFKSLEKIFGTSDEYVVGIY